MSRSKPSPDAGLAKPRGQSPKTVTLRLRVTPELEAATKQAARDANMTWSAWAETAFAAYLHR